MLLSIIFKLYISELSLDAIAPFVISLLSETYFADPAVSARTFSFNLFFLIKLDDLRAEHENTLLISVILIQ